MSSARLLTTNEIFWGHVFDPERSALPFQILPNGQVVTYREAGARVASMMDYLKERGVGYRSNVSILTWNSFEADVVLLASETLRASATFIYPIYDASQVGYIIKDSNSCLLFVDNATNAKKAEGLLPILPLYTQDDSTAGGAAPSVRQIMAERSPDNTLRYIHGELERSRSGQGKFCGIEGSDRARIVYTSGTSGDPKGVPRTHDMDASAVSVVLKLLGITSGDVLSDFLPRGHIFGDFMGQAIRRAGACSVCTAPTPPEEVVNGIKRAEPSVFGSTPIFYSKALQKIKSLTGFKGAMIRWAFKAKLNGWPWPFSAIASRLLKKVLVQVLGPNIRVALTGASATEPEVFAAFSAMGLDIMEGYGLTEAMPVTINWPGARKAGSVGKLLPGMELRIVPYKDDNDADAGIATINREPVTLDPQKTVRDQSLPYRPGGYKPGYSYMTVEGRTVLVGEIQVRGPNVFTEYLNKPEETAKSFEPSGDLDASGNPKGNWFKTGDLGYIDVSSLDMTPDAFLYLYGGRIGRMYKTNAGKKVYPEVVETAMKAAPIEHAVCVGNKRDYNILLVLLSKEQVAALLSEDIKSDPSWLNAAKAAKHPKVISAVKAAIEAGNQQVQSWERCKDFIILPTYALDAGYLTGSGKPKYKHIEKVNQDLIDRKYAERKK